MSHNVNTSTMPPTIDVASLDLRPSAKALELRGSLIDFMHSHVFPAAREYERHRTQVGPGDSTLPPIVEHPEKGNSRTGLWNFLLPAYSGISVDRNGKVP